MELYDVAASVTREFILRYPSLQKSLSVEVTLRGTHLRGVMELKEGWWEGRHTATHCNTLQHTATHCNTLQHTATHFNTLQHTATHRNTPQHLIGVMELEEGRWEGRHKRNHCNTLLRTAKHCNTVQHAAIFCNMLQRLK